MSQSIAEVAKDVPKLDAAETDSDQAGGVTKTETNVLYVKLPEGHPVITASSEEQKTDAPTTELSIEEAIEQAEVIFDDGETVQLEHDQEQLIELNDEDIGVISLHDSDLI